MTFQTENTTGKSLLVPLLLIFISIPYWNSLNCSWHLDDVINILLNPSLHLKSLSYSSLRDTLFAHPIDSGRLYRPVSCLSFALNWFVGQDNVTGYHIVNISIHLVTSFFLYKTILLLLRSPAVDNRFKQYEHFIAAFTTLLWAINPVQTQAVTYIVQRMSLLAALFYLIGIWSYLKARLNQTSNTYNILFFSISIFSFLLALGSKENTATFPVALLLLEIYILKTDTGKTKGRFLYFLLLLVLTVTIGLAIIGPDRISGLLTSYTNRDFTVWQRILTEARIVCWYLSILFYPTPLRLSIDHDVIISTSILSPPTTIVAVCSLALMTLVPIVYRRKVPLLSFALLFFLLNHVIESTFIPLELIFEHRNYLPSLFIFLPISILIHHLVTKYRNNAIIGYLTIATSTTVLILFALGTIERNKVWATERSLWTDALTKAPQTARPYINLAFDFKHSGHLNQAFTLLNQSLDKRSPTAWKDRMRAYNNMGDIMSQIGNNTKAIHFYNQAMSFTDSENNNNYRPEILLKISKAQWFAGNKDAALALITSLTSEFPNNGRFLRFHGEVLAQNGQLDEALSVFNKASEVLDKQQLEQQLLTLDLALCYSKIGSHNKAMRFLNSIMSSPVNPINNIYLYLLEISIRSGDLSKAEYAFVSLLEQLAWPEFIALLNQPYLNQKTILLDYPLLKQYTITWLANQEINE